MEAIQIQNIIEEKVNEWLSSIIDPFIRAQIRDSIIVTGGCITSMLIDEEVNDFDIYLRNEYAAYHLTQYYCNFIPKDIHPVIKEDKILISLPDEKALKNRNPQGKYAIAFISTLAITLTDKIQIVVRFFGEPDKIHESYDFVHCTNYWTSWEKILVLRPDALKAIENKKLIYVGSKYPIASMIRLKKFIDRGWKISSGELLKMSLQISDLDLYDKEQLKEQLSGIYSKDLSQIVKETKIDNNGKIDKKSLLDSIEKHFPSNEK
jgi:hypothetical protein